MSSSDFEAVDRKSNRVATRDMEALRIIGQCRCERLHRTHVEFVRCAIPGAVPTTLSAGEIVVLTRCGDTPRFSLFRSIDLAARLLDKLNAWGCSSPDGCRGHHDIAVVIR
ncbi:hypothetical protein [Prescottella agglutinans]|uniref:Uncharacterized protein n=1 Tax=Prescottella agglutinans TaxID=1644129 RepID=A0ABT6M4Y0_9NOCA|nr:hypothetical protein [Prescottella agglutinans]MDH6279360.1 hypothetical protein [Prescottella agglutinans]